MVMKVVSQSPDLNPDSLPPGHTLQHQQTLEGFSWCSPCALEKLRAACLVQHFLQGFSSETALKLEEDRTARAPCGPSPSCLHTWPMTTLQLVSIWNSNSLGVHRPKRETDSAKIQKYLHCREEKFPLQVLDISQRQPTQLM